MRASNCCVRCVIVRGAGAVGFEVPQGGAGVLASVRQPARLQQGQRDVEAGSPARRGCPTFLEADRLAVVRQGAVDVADGAVDRAELVVRDRQVVHRVGREQGEGLMVRGQRGVQRRQQLDSGRPAARASWNRANATEPSWS